MKALSLDQAGGCPTDPGPLVLRGIEVDGEITIVPVPEDRDLSLEQLKELARHRADQQPQGRESGGAARERGERARAECPEARERRSRRKRGLAPDPEARPHGGPSGADFVMRCGAGRGGREAGWYRTLHYASAMDREPEDRRDRDSTVGTGGS